MIVKRVYITMDGFNRVRVTGWYLFGFIPLYISKVDL